MTQFKLILIHDTIMTLGVCVFKSLTKGYFILKKTTYIFTVTHHNDQYSQMNRAIATETYSALWGFLNNNCSYYCGQFLGFCLTLSPI